MNERLIKEIDAILPQTQCTQCGFPDCRSYAVAIAQSEAEINQCPPGDEAGIRRLATLLGVAPKPLDTAYGVPKSKAIALIDESLCIGCTFCIRACPVDAIAGAAKQMHTVITDECTGCELCVTPCPMDCIQMIPAEIVSDEAKLNAANVARERHQFRLQRLERNAREQAARFDKKVKKVVQTPVSDEARKKATIQAALKRAAAAKVQAAEKKNHPLP